MRYDGKGMLVLSALLGPVALSLALLSVDFFRSTAHAQKIPNMEPGQSPVPAQSAPPLAQPVGSAAPAPVSSGTPMSVSTPAAVATPAPTPTPSRAAPPQVPAERGKTENSKTPGPLSGIIEDYNYNADGKRDPFVPVENPGSGFAAGPIFPLQGYDLDQLKLVGIIWDVRYPKAMVLDPTGKGYVVKVGDRIGRNNGRIARVRESELVVVESFKDQSGKVSYQTKILRLQID